MPVYEISYEYEGKKNWEIVRPTTGWEGQFHQKVLNTIESLVRAGAIITDLKHFVY